MLHEPRCEFWMTPIEQYHLAVLFFLITVTERRNQPAGILAKGGAEAKETTQVKKFNLKQSPA